MMDTTTIAPMESTPAHAIRPKRRRYAAHRTSIVFRSIALASEVIAVASAIAVAAGAGIWEFTGLSISTLIWAIIWDSAEFITLCVNGRGINPIANLVIDLLHVFTLAVAALFDLMWYNLYDGSSDDRPLCEIGNRREGLPAVDCGLWRAGLVCGCFLLLAGLCHLILFICDCVATHRWRRWRHTHRFTGQPQIMQLIPLPNDNSPQFHHQNDPNQNVVLPALPQGMTYVAVPQQILPGSTQQ